MTQPTVRTHLDASDLAGLLDAVHAAFRVHAPELDALNVFPVPDGDTGANMLGTIVAACEDTNGVDAAVRGAVIGARGNSGVILSQVLRALLEGIEETLTGDNLASALDRADELARSAVAEPVEGTMLTVLTAAAEGARTAEGPLGERLAVVLEAVAVAVAETEFVLDANRIAGVVDAGARGIEVLLRAVNDHVCHVELPPAVADGQAGDPAHIVPRSDDGAVEREQGSDDYRWEVQYLLDELRRPDDVAVRQLQRQLTAVGDSVVVVSAGDLLNVHVHTNDIGAAVEAGLSIGHPRRVAVTDFDADVDAGSTSVAVGLVVVLPGAVLAEVASTNGAVVVAGQSGSLPTVGALLDAARRTRAPEVVVIPGHPNAVPTALQAASTQPMHVVTEANALPRALAALAAWDPDGSAVEVAAAMDAIAGHVRVAEVVAAVRDADTSLGPVRRGELLGLVDGDELVAIGDEPRAIVGKVLDVLRTEGGELLTVVAGATAPSSERRDVFALAAGGEQEVDSFVTDAEPARYWLGIE